MIEKYTMKKTLEYKILKYLLDNENEEFLEVSHLSKNVEFLNNKISELKKRSFIKTDPYPPSLSTSSGISITASNKPSKCRIELKGKEYILEIIDKSTNFKFKVISIITGLLLVFFAGWNIQLKVNQSLLIKNIDSLKVQSVLYKDSIVQLKERLYLLQVQPPKDSLQNNN
jgi:hypothetical protein